MVQDQSQNWSESSKALTFVEKIHMDAKNLYNLNKY
jgi:hypothetical protein